MFLDLLCTFIYNQMVMQRITRCFLMVLSSRFKPSVWNTWYYKWPLDKPKLSLAFLSSLDVFGWPLPLSPDLLFLPVLVLEQGRNMKKQVRENNACIELWLPLCVAFPPSSWRRMGPFLVPDFLWEVPLRSPVWIHCFAPPGNGGQRGDAEWWPSKKIVSTLTVKRKALLANLANLLTNVGQT